VSKEKASVKKYYETFGWQKTADKYGDAYFYPGDPRKSNIFYYSVANARLRRNFKHKGEFFLDAGCGAFPHATFSQDFNFHVCVDFTKAGLAEAKRKLVNGMFVMADLTNLPFKTSVFEGAIAMHVLYHLPRDFQANAVNELGRVTAEKSHCLIAYKSNLEGWNALVSLIPQRLRRLNKKNGEQIMPMPDRPPLYSYVFSLKYFENLPSSGYKLKFGTAFLLGDALSSTVVPNGFAGYLVVLIVLFIERFFSGTAAKYSAYPSIVIEKN